MKILLIIDRLGIGGAESHLLQLAEGLARLGDEVVIASGGGALADTCRSIGLRHVRLPLPSHAPRKLLLARHVIRSLVRRERFDVVHAHSRIPALLIRGCRRYGALEIVTVHARFSVNPILSRLCYWGMRTVAVSEDLLGYVCRSYGVAPERVTVIPNGIDHIRFSPAPKKRPANRIGVLFASRLDADCALGAELLCRLAPNLCKERPALAFTIAGGGSEYPRIRALAEQANQAVGREAVAVVGTARDMPSLMQAHHVFVGVSRAAMEAALCGCAVILCGNEGYLGILNGTNAEAALQTNFCARGNPLPDQTRLERDLCALTDAPAFRNSAAEEGRRFLLRHCSADTVCQKTRELYRKSLLPPVRKRILVGGYFGCGNLGDDAILSGLIGELQENHPGLAPTILTGSPQRHRRRFGLPCIHRKNPIAILCALLSCDAFWLGGGSLLQNRTSNRSLAYYLVLLRLSRLLKKPTVLCAVGVGPLLGKSAKAKTAAVLSDCSYISLRDDRSHRLLRSIGTDASKLRTGADLALLLPAPTPAHLRLMPTPPPLRQLPERFLCVVLKGGADCKALCSILTAAVRTVCQRHQISPVLAIFDQRRDERASHSAALALQSTVAVCRTPLWAQALLTKARAVVTVRLHAMVLATAVGTPALGLCPDPHDEKLKAFARLSGQQILEEPLPDLPTLVKRLESLIEKPKGDPILRAATEEMRKNAQKDLANIAEMIYNIDSNA